MTMPKGAPIERYMTSELAELWFTQGGVGKFDFIHQVEIALAQVHAELGRIPQEATEAIAASTFDPEEIIRRGGHDVNAYLDITRDTIPPEHRGALHLGATSFDVQDTGVVLMLIKSAEIILLDLSTLQDDLRQLARQHKDTLMVGRTHGVHAKPITFAFKVCNWMGFIERAGKRLSDVRQEIAFGKMSGAVGMYTSPPEVEERLCEKLGLRPAPVTTQILPRDLHADFFHAITCVAAACEYIATDIRNHQRTDIYEMAEPFPKGMKGSTAMPHKRNPEKCEQICGLARVVRNDMGAIIENITTWHERSLEQSSAERLLHAEMILLTGYIVRSLQGIISGLEVHSARMWKNLEMTHGAIYSEAAKILLLGKGLDPEVVYRAVQASAIRAFDGDGDLKTNLLADSDVGRFLTEGELDKIMDPWKEVQYRQAIYDRFGL